MDTRQQSLLADMRQYFAYKRLPPCILLLLSHNHSKYCNFVRNEIETKAFFPCEIRVLNNMRMGDVLTQYQQEGINFVCIVGKSNENNQTVNYRNFSSNTQRRHEEKPLVGLIDICLNIQKI